MGFSWGVSVQSLLLLKGYQLEVGASCGDPCDPAVRHVPAGAQVELLEVGASGGDRLDPAVRHRPAAAVAGGWGIRRRPP